MVQENFLNSLIDELKKSYGDDIVGLIGTSGLNLIKDMCYIIDTMNIIDERLNQLNENVEVAYINHGKLMKRFMSYMMCKMIGEDDFYKISKNTKQDDKSVDPLKLIGDFKQGSAILEKKPMLLDTLKEESAFSLKRLMYNRFYNTEESKFRKAIDVYEKAIARISKKNRLSKDQNIAIAEMIFKKELSKLAKVIFDGILKDIEVSKTQNNKSLKARLLFPLFQITHPVRCIEEKIWEKTRDTNRDYKAYQSDTVKKIIGIK